MHLLDHRQQQLTSRHSLPTHNPSLCCQCRELLPDSTGWQLRRKLQGVPVRKRRLARAVLGHRLHQLKQPHHCAETSVLSRGLGLTRALCHMQPKINSHSCISVAVALLEGRDVARKRTDDDSFLFLWLAIIQQAMASRIRVSDVGNASVASLPSTRNALTSASSAAVAAGRSPQIDSQQQPVNTSNLSEKTNQAPECDIYITSSWRIACALTDAELPQPGHRKNAGERRVAAS